MDSVASSGQTRADVAKRERGDPSLELWLKASVDCLCVIREAVAALLTTELVRRHQSDRLPEIMLALQEASTNVVRHAYRDFPEPGTIGVRCKISAQLLRLEVIDQGQGYDFDHTPPPDFSQPRDGGFGLHLVRSTMSRVAYQSRGGRNTLRMEMKLRDPELARPKA
jgi:anti-sigma regulatory factor (Ser/Thr protein kinase)